MHPAIELDPTSIIDHALQWIQMQNFFLAKTEMQNISWVLSLVQILIDSSNILQPPKQNIYGIGLSWRGGGIPLTALCYHKINWPWQLRGFIPGIPISWINPKSISGGLC